MRNRRYPLPTVDVLACPCCGESKVVRHLKSGKIKGLDAGIQSSMEYGVRCYTCGLQMTRTVPDRWHPKTKDMSLDDSMSYMEQFALDKAVEAWNRRA